MPKNQAVSVRTHPAVYVGFDAYSGAHGVPLSTAQTIMQANFEKDNPVGFQIKRVITDDGAAFALCWTPTGRHIDTFGSIEAAKAGLKAFREARGFDLRRFKLAEEIAIVDLREHVAELSNDAA